MLAYVFWHWPRPGIALADYEAALGRFHRSLADDPPAGFSRSLTFRVGVAPWLDAQAQGYEDWYLVDGFAALESLNVGAVSGSRTTPHERAARAAAGGAGGLYRLRHGDLDLADARQSAWLGKPESVGYADFDALLQAQTEGLPVSLWNTTRPHSALGRVAPAVFAQRLAASTDLPSKRPDSRGQVSTTSAWTTNKVYVQVPRYVRMLREQYCGHHKKGWGGEIIAPALSRKTWHH